VRLAVAADIRRRGVDAVLCLGDNLAGPLLPRFLRTAAGPCLVNPGSVGPQADVDDEPECYVVEQVDGTWHCSQHAMPYDHRAMAALARRNTRPEWARALLTGYVS
jgi:hypothetical protein